jgi:hypothetical protein
MIRRRNQLFVRLGSPGIVDSLADIGMAQTVPSRYSRHQENDACPMKVRFVAKSGQSL